MEKWNALVMDNIFSVSAASIADNSRINSNSGRTTGMDMLRLLLFVCCVSVYGVGGEEYCGLRVFRLNSGKDMIYRNISVVEGK